MEPWSSQPQSLSTSHAPSNNLGDKAWETGSNHFESGPPSPTLSKKDQIKETEKTTKQKEKDEKLKAKNLKKGRERERKEKKKSLDAEKKDTLKDLKRDIQSIKNNKPIFDELDVSLQDAYDSDVQPFLGEPLYNFEIQHEENREIKTNMYWKAELFDEG